MDSAKSVNSSDPQDNAEPPHINGDEVLARLKAATGSASDSALAAFFKVPYSTLASWRRRNAVPIDALVSVANFSGSSLDWLLLGKSRNGQVQDEASTRPLFPNFSQMAVKYGLEFASLIHRPKIENLSSLSTSLLISCISAQAHIDQLIEHHGGDEETLQKQMDLWITRIVLNLPRDAICGS